MSRERLASIVDSMMEAVITVDRTQRIVLFNKAAETIFRCPSEQAFGKTLDAFIPERFRASHRQHIQEFGHTGVTRRSMSSPGVLVGLRADGEEFPMEAMISQAGSDGEKLLTVVLRDITERKLAEEKLVVAGRMTATVAHEINGPLEAVANILFLLERAELSHTAHEFVHAAQEEVKRITRITKLTLGFYREGERGAAEVRASELIDGILTLYGHRIESLGVTIVKRYDNIGAAVADAGELRQVLSNLIVNAAEALANKGDKLVIHVCDSQDWRGTGRRGVRITITDNGSGIPREVRHKLFEPFFTTKGEKGTGLGLWVSRSLVEKHGGRLRVRSIAGIGTTFSIFLPSSVAHAKVA